MAEGQGEKVAIVTGATGGIGRWIALGLARAGCHVVLVGRDAARGAAALRWIADSVPGASLAFMQAELSLLAEVGRLGAALRARHPRIAVLVNNAGMITRRRTITAEGHEAILAVNHLAPFVLTGTLEPALRAEAARSGEARVVEIGSSTSDGATVDPDDLELARHHWSIQRAYGRSKLALMMTGFERARRLAGTGVAVNVVHPGLVRTAIAAKPGVVGLSWRLLTLFALEPEQGADTPLHVALAPELRGVTGTYFKKRQEAAPNRLARDADLVARVWAATERLAAR
jgi:NAD(P)-dependent dehydrogenase (short-subunit alcohol dehydrogenase family)